MTRDGLWTSFSAAQAKGWDVKKEDFPELVSEPFFPDSRNVFRALELIGPSDVRYVILGQDPYYDTRKGTDIPIATGVAFGVECLDDVKPSCAIHKVLKGIYPNGIHRRQFSNLEHWSTSKGVLLLNAALTVQAGPENRRNAHAGKHIECWHKFVVAILDQVKRSDVSMIAWGAKAHEIYVNALGREPGASCNHPVASRGKLGQFSEFWRKGVGGALRAD